MSSHCLWPCSVIGKSNIKSNKGYVSIIITAEGNVKVDTRVIRKYDVKFRLLSIQLKAGVLVSPCSSVGLSVHIHGWNCVFLNSILSSIVSSGAISCSILSRGDIGKHMPPTPDHSYHHPICHTLCHHLSAWTTVWCRYIEVNFCQDPHNRDLIARPWGRAMGCLLWF